VLAGPDGQVDVVERGSLPAGITHADRPDYDVLPAEVGVTGRLRASTDRPGGIEDLEGALRGGGAFRAGVEFGSGVAQTAGRPRGEQQDQQRRLVADVTGQQPEADLHRDQVASAAVSSRAMDKNATRSVAMVAVRCVSVTCLITSACAWPGRTA
jgi:hypothetical protein